MEIELRMLEEDPQVNIHPEGISVTLKKIANRKTPGFNGIHGFWFEKFTFLHDRLATEMNKCTENSNGWPKGRQLESKKTPPKELPQQTNDP